MEAGAVRLGMNPIQAGSLAAATKPGSMSWIACSDTAYRFMLTSLGLSMGHDPGAGVAFRPPYSSGMRSPPSSSWMPRAGPSI